jgi:hypothetical protein
MKSLRLLLGIIFLFFYTGHTQVMINGLCWATCNVDMPGTFAAKPEDAGMFYQWGSNVGWSSTDPLTASDGINVWRDLSESGNDWLLEKNPCPAGWRVPSVEEFQSLCSASNYWGNLNGIDGRFFGNNEPRIFLPVVGQRGSGGGLANVAWGCYWSSTRPALNAHIFNFNDTQTNPTAGIAVHNATPIRCVAEPLLCGTFEAAFYANEVLHSELPDTTFCNKQVNFRAEVQGLHPDQGSLKWYTDGSEETSAETWSKSFENGEYEIKMWVRFENDEEITIISTLKIQALWIKMRNIRY